MLLFIPQPENITNYALRMKLDGQALAQLQNFGKDCSISACPNGSFNDRPNTSIVHDFGVSV